MGKLLRAALAVGALCLSASSASAAEYVATFTGTMASGHDFDRFGVGGDLTGMAFTASYLINSDAPGAILNDSIFGLQLMDGFRGSSPIRAASLTINGVTLNSSHYFGHLQENFSYSFESSLYYEHGAYVIDNHTDGFGVHTHNVETIYLALGIYGPSGTLSDGDVFTAPVGTYTTADGTFFGSFLDGYNNYNDVDGVRIGMHASGTFGPTSLTVTSVPEPATWALAILGFGAIGAVLRRRATGAIA